MKECYFHSLKHIYYLEPTSNFLCLILTMWMPLCIFYQFYLSIGRAPIFDIFSLLDFSSVYICSAVLLDETFHVDHPLSMSSSDTSLFDHNEINWPETQVLAESRYCLDIYDLRLNIWQSSLPNDVSLHLLVWQENNPLLPKLYVGNIQDIFAFF